MIEKILKIKNVGRFRDFSGSGDEVSFKKNTFIFGKNTQGKSTFTSILKSLDSNNPDLIIGRKTFGSINQEVKIKSSTLYSFNGSWDKNCKIKFFDSEYISSNIFTEDTITTDKQSTIASIILGVDGKDLEQKWIDSKKEIDNVAGKKREISNLYGTSFPNSILNFKDFSKLQEDKDIDNHINEVESQIKSYSNQSSIDTLLKGVSSKANGFSVDKTELSKTLNIDQSIVDDHISNNLLSKEGASNFLSTGLQYYKDGTCSFCSQSIDQDAKELIKAYQVLFSENYKKLKNAIDTTLSYMTELDIEGDLLTGIHKLDKLGLKVDIQEYIEEISKNKSIFIKELQYKKSDLTYEINLLPLSNLESAIENIQSIISEPLKKYSAVIDKEEVTSLENTLSVLKLQKIRYEQTWVTKCKEYVDLEEETKSIIKPAEEKCFKEKNEYAKKILSIYESSINEILTKLGANFKLSSFTIPETRRRSLELFSLIFNGHSTSIPLIATDDKPNIKNTLSESDKRLLAFAFFIVDIKNTNDIENYIVVLDDPMSSFDIARKRQTVKILRDELINSIGNTPQQLIVLTHENNFYKILHKIINDEVSTLKIEYDTLTNTSSVLPCDLEHEFLKLEYYKKLEYYNDCISGSIGNIQLSDMRIIIEEIIKVKYYLIIPTNKIKTGGIVSWYKENKGTTIINKEIDDIDSHISHHTSSCEVGEEDYEEPEKQSIVKDFLLLINKI